MGLFLSIYPLGLLAFLLHVAALPSASRSASHLLELLLAYQIFFNIGLTSLVSFFGLTFMAQYIADYTGWTVSPFEQQLANVNLAFAVLGILSIWFRQGFWLATIVGFSIWILGDAIHHLYHYIVYKNSLPGNIGAPFWTDVIIPLWMLCLLFFYYRNA